MTRNRIIAGAALLAGVVAILGVVAFSRRREDQEKPLGERVGEAAVDATATVINAGVGMVKGAGNALAGKVWPVEACAAAMNKGDVLGAAWECRPATFVSWIAAGRPSNVSVIEGGAILAPAKKVNRGASGTW